MTYIYLYIHHIYIYDDYDTNNGDHKGLPTFWIPCKTVTDDVVSSQTANSRYQRWKDLLIGLVDISLRKKTHTHINAPLHIQ